MITQIGERDSFGYDDSGRPCAAQIGSNVTAFGYPICLRLKSAVSIGFQIAYRLYSGDGAIIAIYSPQSRQAEIWFGRWTEDHPPNRPSCYHVVNPSYQGLTQETFDTLDALNGYLASSDRIPLQPGYLQTTGDLSEVVRPDITADGQLQSRLERPTERFPNCQIDIALLTEDERHYAEDIQYLLKNLFEYVYRVRAAVELCQYADSMHFALPATILPTQQKFSLLVEWKCMAARDAAFSIFHFQRTFEHFREQIPRHCHSLRNKLDIEKLRIAWKLYQSWFRNTVRTRHAIGHTAEFYMTVEDRARHATHKDIFIESFMMDTVLSLPFSGEFVSIDVSIKTVEKLERVQTLILESYSPILKPR